MKITIITDYYKKAPTSLYDCKTQFHLFTYYINKYLSRININIVIQSAPIKGKTISHNHCYSSYDTQKSNHIIIVQNKACYARNNKFISKLRNNVSGTICSFGISNVYLGSEDVLFYINSNSLITRKNTSCVGFCSDSSDLFPNKTQKIINILIDIPKAFDHKNHHDCYNNITKYVGDFIKANNYLIPIECYKHSNNYYENYSGDKIAFNNYKERFDLYNKTNIFIVTTPNVNYNTLINLGMANCVIVAPKNILKKNIIELLDIIEYDKVLPWNIIIEKINTVDTRNILIKNNYTWENAVNKIYNYIVDKYDSSTINNNNITAKQNKENNSKTVNDTKKTKTITSHKFIQSRLRTKNYSIGK